nr:hypothetical protein [Marseillevirus cajuinensis]
MEEPVCPFCEKDLEDEEMNEGWFCEDCGHIYFVCTRCDNGKYIEFISASIPLQDLSSYEGMKVCCDSKIEEKMRRETRCFGKGNLPRGNVVVVNKASGLCYADVGKGNGLSEPACYIWKCGDCGRYEETCSD